MPTPTASLRRICRLQTVSDAQLQALYTCGYPTDSYAVCMS
jgi:hypothetical protein